MCSNGFSRYQKFLILIVLVAVFSLMAGGCQPEEPETETAATQAPAWPEGASVVTSSADSGPGSLRQALQDARDGDTIVFDPSVFPPGAPVAIVVTSEELPHINIDNLTLDGFFHQ